MDSAMYYNFLYRGIPDFFSIYIKDQGLYSINDKFGFNKIIPEVGTTFEDDRSIDLYMNARGFRKVLSMTGDKFIWFNCFEERKDDIVEILNLAEKRIKEFLRYSLEDYNNFYKEYAAIKRISDKIKYGVDN